MNIPNFENTAFVDRNGHLTDAWRQILTQLFTEMQASVSNQGFVTPSKPTSEIIDLSAVMPSGTVIYNGQTHKGMLSENGVFKTIVTS